MVRGIVLKRNMFKGDEFDGILMDVIGKDVTQEDFMRIDEITIEAHEVLVKGEEINMWVSL